MQHTYFVLLAFASLAFTKAPSQTFCDSSVTANVIIYSNYDGGALTIDVDQNIPNLKIGIVSYEFSHITITGTYASNVTAVWYVGYNGNNNHCNLTPLTTTITGVPNNVDSIILYPAATYSNPNGYGSIICNYSCSTTTNQGGCNTADQVAHFFLTNWGGTLRYHRTLYNCWPSNPASISNGGNCCANPLSTEVAETSTTSTLHVSPNPSNGIFQLGFPQGASSIEVVNLLGEAVKTISVNPTATTAALSLEGEAPGIYFVRMQGQSTAGSRIVLE